VARLGDDGVVHRIEASDAERLLLARRFGIVALDRFAAEVRLTREPSVGVRVEAAIEADIVQDCVVTLEPFASRLSDRATVVYRRRAPRESETVDVGEDDVELLDGDEIDIGEAARPAALPGARSVSARPHRAGLRHPAGRRRQGRCRTRAASLRRVGKAGQKVMPPLNEVAAPAVFV